MFCKLLITVHWPDQEDVWKYYCTGARHPANSGQPIQRRRVARGWEGR